MTGGVAVKTSLWEKQESNQSNYHPYNPYHSCESRNPINQTIIPTTHIIPAKAGI